jgi:hypothetical protein
MIALVRQPGTGERDFLLLAFYSTSITLDAPSFTVPTALARYCPSGSTLTPCLFSRAQQHMIIIQRRMQIRANKNSTLPWVELVRHNASST